MFVVNPVDALQLALDLVVLLFALYLSARMVLLARETADKSLSRTFLVVAVVFLLLFALQVASFFADASNQAQLLFALGVQDEATFKLLAGLSSYPWGLVASLTRLVVLLVLFYVVMGLVRTMQAYEHLLSDRRSRGLE